MATTSTGNFNVLILCYDEVVSVLPVVSLTSGYYLDGTGKPSRYTCIANTEVNSAFHLSGIGKSNLPTAPTD